MAGSPRVVKYSAGRSGVALAKTIWWASVVLPLPGAPAMILKENSGRPPPRISSRPGTPVGSLFIFTFSAVLKLSPPSILLGNAAVEGGLRPHILNQPQR